MEAFFARLLDEVTVTVIVLLFLFSIVNWVLGSLRALASHQWDVTLWDVFIRKDIAGRVIPLTIVILLGRTVEVALPGAAKVPGLDIGIITATAYVSAVPYIMAKVKSILEAINPTEPDRPPLPE